MGALATFFAELLKHVLTMFFEQLDKPDTAETVEADAETEKKRGRLLDAIRDFDGI